MSDFMGRCSDCAYLRQKLWAASTQIRPDLNDDGQISAVDQSVLGEDRQSPAYQQALEDLREHMRSHHDVKLSD